MNTQEIRKLSKDVRGHMTPLELMTLHTYATKVKRGHCVEIGSFQGLSTIALARGLTSGSNQFVYAIDPHEPYLDVSDTNAEFKQEFGYADMAAFLHNIVRYGVQDRVMPVAMPSFAVEFTLPIGLLFIDGRHDYESVFEDVASFESRIVHCGYLIFHDSLWSGPKRVIQYHKDYCWSTYKLVEEVDALTIFMKRIPKYD